MPLEASTLFQDFYYGYLLKTIRTEFVIDFWDAAFSDLCRSRDDPWATPRIALRSIPRRAVDATLGLIYTGRDDPIAEELESYRTHIPFDPFKIAMRSRIPNPHPEKRFLQPRVHAKPQYVHAITERYSAPQSFTRVNLKWDVRPALFGTAANCPLVGIILPCTAFFALPTKVSLQRMWVLLLGRLMQDMQGMPMPLLN